MIDEFMIDVPDLGKWAAENAATMPRGEYSGCTVDNPGCVRLKVAGPLCGVPAEMDFGFLSLEDVMNLYERVREHAATR